MKPYFRALGIWLVVMVLAFANGALREFSLKKLLGLRAGHLVSTLILTSIILIIAYYYVKANAIRLNIKSFVPVGVLWLAMTLGFEFLVGHYIMGHPWEKMLADYNLAEGRIWMLIPLAMLFSPIVYYLILRR